VKIAYFDCLSGISGDMILGALVDLGVPLESLKAQLQNLKLKGYNLEARIEEIHHLRATQVEVKVSGAQPDRHLADIRRILEESPLSEGIREKALVVFDRLAEVEAAIHGVSKEEVHFHEVGAVDAIVDVVGSLIGLEILGVEKVYSSPVSLGSGHIKAAHGVLPVPSPATLKLLEGFPVRKTNIPAELATPTGVAILTTLAEKSDVPTFQLQKVGYGAGHRKLKEIPNLLRIFLGEVQIPGSAEQLLLVETNIDDMNPELYPHVMERLFESGALDVYLTPVIMKKGRPGMVISALIPMESREVLIQTLYRETTTLGVRVTPVQRWKLPRDIRVVSTPLGEVRVKVSYLDNHIQMTPEFEDCRRIAREKGMPLREVYQQIQASLTQQGMLND